MHAIFEDPGWSSQDINITNIDIKIEDLKNGDGDIFEANIVTLKINSVDSR